ncbi:DUF4435 domain-containing protein [Janthinobacterium sp. NKUCC08_JDC]|uniref:DUF4435 domain-containing protein n=1 Tax=Janthinobacterium sp. NKUCC08_JDC TaxID=2842122 RepID=UPI001C5B98F8|nr:DUF4435 domain-containing protein [Janthinobacterium sp. NKUCC08_JDC]MBW3498222.1 DUF4435 domain-containing protein [Janthinobacterium sp. NKUCC08_JDC]
MSSDVEQEKDLILQDQNDAYLKRMKDSKGEPAVLKARFVTLRSHLPDGFVFAFEGNDDKTVYSHWIRKLSPGLIYEHFLCNGKFFVLQLKGILERDLNGLDKQVYFFVDRDFDDLQGSEATDRIFMTDQYSIENYLVCESVVDEVLKHEVHCHSEPKIRRSIVDLFSKAYSQFLNVTKEHNHYLFAVRRIGIDATPTGSVNRLVEVRIDEVTRCDVSVFSAIGAVRPLTDEELEGYREEFEALTPTQRYRGKFAYIFLMRWLQRVCFERNAEESDHFSGIMNFSEARAASPTLDSLAAKSLPPCGLGEFLTRCEREAA